METHIVQDISVCEELWKRFSPGRTLWDEWAVVKVLYDKKSHKPYFIVVKEGKEEVGLLPLWEDLAEEVYTYFGGTHIEDMTFWFPKEAMGKVLETMPENTSLFDMNCSIEEYFEGRDEYQPCLEKDEYHYYIDLERIKWRFEDYLARFGKKHKHNLLYDLRKLKDKQYTLTWSGQSHHELLVAYSLQRFKEDSDYSEEDLSKEEKRFLTAMEERGAINTLLISIGDEVKGVEIAVHDKKRGNYYVINGGYDTAHRNLGKLLIVEHIKQAIELEARQVDFLSGSQNSWKELWNLDKKPYITFRKRLLLKKPADRA